MKPQNRNYRLYLEDIMTSMTRIEEYIGDMNFRKFEENRLVVDAVIRNFEIIGEAAKNVPKSFKEKHPMVPWEKMYRLRNLVTRLFRNRL